MAELSKVDKKRLDKSYEFGSTSFWECLEGIDGKKIDDEAVGMEILYQAVQFLGTKGWTEDAIFKYVKNVCKDAIANKLYQQELSKVKVAHRQAGELTDEDRAIIAKEKKKLKEGDPVDITKEISPEELSKAKPEAADLN